MLVASDYAVDVIDDLSRGSAASLEIAAPSSEVLVGDIRHRGFVDDIFSGRSYDAIIHLAALHYIPDCDADPQRCVSINVGGTQNLLDSARAASSVRAVVFASTAAVYSPQEAPHSEHSPLGPTDIYGASKLACEELLKIYAQRAGVPVGIARLFNVFGPGETNPHLVPTIVQQMTSAQTLALGNLESRRDYVYTEDVAAAFLALMNACIEGRAGTYNVGTGVATSGAQVVSTLAAVLGERKTTVTRDPSRLRVSDRPVLVADISRATHELDWRPQVDLAAGLLEAMSAPFQLSTRETDVP
jgi:UDP-glucose 4-epimerase